MSEVMYYIEPSGLPSGPWPRTCLQIDAREIDEHLPREVRGMHIGSNAQILDHLLTRCRPFVVKSLKALLEFMRRAPADAKEPVLVACMCNWGKHRSVAMAWFINTLLKHLGHDTHVWHMNYWRWAKQSCGRNPCKDCDLDNDDKYRLAYRLYRIWDDLFAPPNVG